MKFNFYAFKAIYLHEMDRFRRTMMQSLFSPVLSTSLYFIVFGSVIGGYVENIDGISYGSYIVPGLLMLTLLTQSISNTSFGIFFPKFNGTIYEILAAPISTFEIVIAFVGAGATKTLIVGACDIYYINFLCRSGGDVSIINDFFISARCFYFRIIWFFNWIDEF
jgi:ABC-2 type transport system permease protein